MKASRCAAWAMALLGAGAAAPRADAQGSLAPPGAPGPMMKTLAQIEPRTPITNLPFTISQPGSYYLTTNLSSSSHGIVIATNGVALDLMGFALTGARTVGFHGVYALGSAAAPLRDIVVRNGIVRNFGDGVRLDQVRGGRLDRLQVATNASNGIMLYGHGGACLGVTITDCASTDNTGDGIQLHGDSGRCDGHVIDGCTVSGNGGQGVDFYGYNGQCEGNLMIRTAICDNKGEGISLDGNYIGRCIGNRIVECTVDGNGPEGIYGNGTASSGACNGNVIERCVVRGSTIGILLTSGSPRTGQCDGNAVVDCVVRENDVCGIRLVTARRNRLEGNHVTGQTNAVGEGIGCYTTSSNLIVRNSCMGQVYNFGLVAADTYGPTVTNQGALGVTGPAAHPWANFKR